MASAGTAQAEPPPEQKGFQLALRTGVAIPFGTVSPTTSMSDAIGPQIPLIVDIGFKPTTSLFFGAYLGAAVGGTAGELKAACERYAVNCVGGWFRGGLLAQYNVHPDRTVNPWIGYGIGYEIGGTRGSNIQNSIRNDVRGFEFAHLLGGLDFRIQDYFGIGPFIDGALGMYQVAKTKIDSGGYVLTAGSNDGTSFHLWLILGIRAVMRP
jgi:hypothetical protein